MPSYFISYRREDSAGHAGRLFDHLAERFGRSSVFMDVAGIEPGVDFVEAIDRAVGSCEALIALIGKEWLTRTDASGRRRLDDPEDLVRLEVGAALRRNVRVIPVLVEGATMPRNEALPPDLQRLARRQAIEISDTRWDSDLGQLIRALESLGASRPPSSAKWRRSGMAAVVATVGAGAALLYFHPWSQPTLSHDEGAAKSEVLPQDSRPSEPDVSSVETDATRTRPPAPAQGTDTTTGSGPDSKAAPSTRVPDVHGRSEDDARRLLTAAGLTVGKVERLATGRLRPGLVVRQSPVGATSVSPGKSVDLFVEAPIRRQPAATVASGRFEFHAGTSMDLDSSPGPGNPTSVSDRRVPGTRPPSPPGVDISLRPGTAADSYVSPMNGAVLALMDAEPDYDRCIHASMEKDSVPVQSFGQKGWACVRTNLGRYSILGIARGEIRTTVTTRASVTLVVNYVTFEPQRRAQPLE